MKCLVLSVLLLVTALGSSGALRGAEVPPPKSWPPHPFEPLTAKRIAALPAGEREAWEAYWEASQQLAAKLPARTEESPPAHPLSTAPKGAAHTIGLSLNAAPAWYATPEAQIVADRIVAWQSGAGAWMKGIDYTHPRVDAPASSIWISGTFDNDATILELRFLARVITAATDAPHAAEWRASFTRGMGYIFAAQYPNGGFPQIYPLAGGYHDGVTFNDDATAHVLALLQNAAAGRDDYSFVPPELRGQAADRLARGVRCVLATQLRDASGQLTAWCQQYDALTLKPSAARNFEPIADASQESAGLALFLMRLPQPGPDVIAAVEGVVAWFRHTALPDVRRARIPAEKRAGLVPSPGATIWARFYEPGTTTPIFGDRDRTIHYALAEISAERRAGYSWYSDSPATALKRYERWRREIDGGVK